MTLCSDLDLRASCHNINNTVSVLQTGAGSVCIKTASLVVLSIVSVSCVLDSSICCGSFSDQLRHCRSCLKLFSYTNYDRVNSCKITIVYVLSFASTLVSLAAFLETCVATVFQFLCVTVLYDDYSSPQGLCWQSRQIFLGPNTGSNVLVSGLTTNAGTRLFLV